MKQYSRIKKSCLIIQQRYHAFVEMRKNFVAYQNLRISAIVIQSAVRCHLARKKFSRMKKAAIVLQSFIRRTISQKSYFNARRKIIFVQRLYRSRCLTIKERNSYLDKRKSIIFLQSKVRSIIARKKFLITKKACVLIQSTFRMWKQKLYYTKLRQAAIAIQKSYRNLQITKETRCQYLRTRQACIEIQASYRMIVHRRKYKKLKSSSILIQQKFRALCNMRKCREDFISLKVSCIKIQTFFRMKAARRDFLKVQHACITVQSFYRMYVAHKRFLLVKKSVSILEKYMIAYKVGKMERQRYIQLKKSAVVIQASFRTLQQRRIFRSKKSACILIQACIRRYFCQKQYLKQRKAVINIQRHFKAVLIGRKTRDSYLRKRNAIVNLQARTRGLLTRRYIQKLNRSAVKIQASYRSFICRKHYLMQKDATIVLQRQFRAVLLGSKIRLHYLKLKSSAIIIQSVWRSIRVRQDYLRKKAAAVLLQSHVRKVFALRKFMTLKSAAIVIQRRYVAYRAGLKERHSYQEKIKSCMKIQSCWRNCLIRRKIKIQISAAILIQRWYRSWKRRKEQLKASNIDAQKQHLWYMHLRDSTTRFQHHARKYLLRRNKSVVTIQTYVRMWLAQQQYKKQRAALKIQALWRGYCVRKAITDKKIIMSMQNIRKAQSDKNNEQNCLRSRTTRALSVLLTDKNLSHILNALQNLDVCTQLSAVCCERLVESKGLPIILLLVRQCNRSVPHKEIIKFATNILLNLAKYTKTVDSVWEESESLSTILNLMKIYREKGVTIFTKCCTLFWIFCQHEDKVQILKENDVFTKDVRFFHDLYSRKQALEQKKSSSKFTTIPRQSVMTSRESLQIDPDWLLGKHRTREFKSPYNAISSLMYSLQLKPKEN